MKLYHKVTYPENRVKVTHLELDWHSWFIGFSFYRRPDEINVNVKLLCLIFSFDDYEDYDIPF